MIAVDTCKTKLSALQNTDRAHCHWSAESQPYASGDILIDYLRNGWMPEHLATVETFYFPDNRCVHIFHFLLRKETRTLVMPVVANPVIHRLIQECGIDCVPAPQHSIETP